MRTQASLAAVAAAVACQAHYKEPLHAWPFGSQPRTLNTAGLSTFDRTLLLVRALGLLPRGLLRLLHAPALCLVPRMWFGPVHVGEMGGFARATAVHGANIVMKN